MIARRIDRIKLVVEHPETIAFYRDALGFEVVGTEDRPHERCIVLRLGQEVVEIVFPAEAGAPYPPGSASNDLWFQHFAVVVSDMQAAYNRLERFAAAAISSGPPVRLPASSGGVTAFKFRDPEGHPLELLQFPPDRTPSRWRGVTAPGPCLGIDHTAIAVADTAASVHFYEQLGFAVSARSLNRGTEQARLDGLTDPIVEVTALGLPRPGPHLELLCYRTPPRRPAEPAASDDIVATTTVLEADRSELLHDPDGHRLRLTKPGATSADYAAVEEP